MEKELGTSHLARREIRFSREHLRRRALHRISCAEGASARLSTQVLLSATLSLKVTVSSPKASASPSAKHFSSLSPKAVSSPKALSRDSVQAESLGEGIRRNEDDTSAEGARHTDNI